MKKTAKKVVLAYSGGLDTSIIVPWLKENYGCEVIACVIDVGQVDDLRPRHMLHLAWSIVRNPYVLGGWTRIEYDHDPGETQTLNGWEFGAGAKVRLVPRVFVRLDARDAVVEQDAPHEWLHNPIVTGGVHLVLGGRQRDTDADGVADAIDRCPGTPRGCSVDELGCPIDSDGDGVGDLRGLTAHLDEIAKTAYTAQ